MFEQTTTERYSRGTGTKVHPVSPQRILQYHQIKPPQYQLIINDSLDPATLKPLQH